MVWGFDSPLRDMVDIIFKPAWVVEQQTRRLQIPVPSGVRVQLPPWAYMSYPTEKNREYLRERYRKQQDDFIDHMGGVCIGCGAVDNLQFDHIDPSAKSFTISRLWSMKQLPRVYEELEKCQLLCEQCHIKKSAKESSERNAGFTHGTVYGWMKKHCACGSCLGHKRDWQERRNAARRKHGGYGPRKRG